MASASNTSYTSGANTFSNLEIWNSTIIGGYFGMTVYSSSGNLNSGLDIFNTKFQDVYYYGTYMYYGARDVKFTKCSWDKPTYLNNGLGYSNYLYYCNNVTFIKNKITSYPYGSYFYYVNYSGALATDQCLIYNNMFAANNHSTTYSYGIFAYYTANAKAYYNSVRCDGLNTTYSYAYPLYFYYNSNPDVRNNAFAINATSQSYTYFYSPSGTINYNYNTFWAYNPNMTWSFYYGTTVYTSLTALQTGSGSNLNSQMKDPQYVSKTDLHITGADLYQKGIAIATVTDDFDGTTRPTVPSHGAHEFTPPAHDAAVTVFIQPVAQCADTNDIVVKVKNFGTNALDSVRVYWSWTGNTGSGSGMKFLQFNPALATGKDTNVFINNVFMTSGAPGYNFLARTQNPDGLTDENPKNDTCKFYTQTAMEGSYTIGGTTPDFATFTAAVNGLNTFGVCGPVVFYARSGTYTERVAISNLLGTSAVNTVTFTTDTNNTAPVKITYSSTSTTNEGTIFLDNAQYITFDGFDIENLGSSYGDGFAIMNNCSYITISNNNVNIPSTSSLCRPLYIYKTSGTTTDLNIHHNTFSGGYYGAYIYGYSGSGVGMYNLHFDYNTISNSYYYGMIAYYFSNSTLIGNTIDMVGGTSYANYAYGAMLYGYGVNYQIENNLIHAGYYGLYLVSMSGQNNNYSTLINNKIMIGDKVNGATLGYYTMYTSNIGFFRIAHNLFLSQTINGYTVYITGGLNHVYNNIFGRVNSGTNMYVSGSFSITEADNNAYLCEGGASQSTGLTYMQSLGYDANGVAVGHLYDSLDLYTLFTCNDTLVGAGVPLSYAMIDIDGSTRSQSAPTIGPHEYISPDGFSLGNDMKLCDGDTITLGSQIVGASYLWNTNDTTGTIEVTETGSYSVTVTTSCGVGEDTIDVINASSQPAFAGQQFYLTFKFTNQSVNGVTYLWDFGDGETSTEEHPTHLFAQNGEYNVCLTAYGECDDNQTCSLVNITVGVDELGKNAIDIYPNPASDLLTIEASAVDGNVLSIEISNISGQVVMNKALNDFNGYAKVQLDISDLTKGVYFVKIFNSEVTTTKRLVVQD
jgi:hypothetical protein